MNYACTGPVSRAAHPHNFVLQFSGEWGLPAAAGLAAVLCMTLFALWKGLVRGHLSDQTKQVAGLLAVGLVAAVGYSLLSGIFIMPASQVAGLLVCGWLMGLIEPSNRTGPSRETLATTAIVAGLLISATVTWFSYQESAQRESRETLMPPRELGLPRYWQLGKLCKYFDDSTLGQ